MHYECKLRLLYTNCLFIKPTETGETTQWVDGRERERKEERRSYHKPSAVCVTHRCRGVKCDKADNDDNGVRTTTTTTI